MPPTSSATIIRSTVAENSSRALKGDRRSLLWAIGETRSSVMFAARPQDSMIKGLISSPTAYAVRTIAYAF
jgi:hypothetical protein